MKRLGLILAALLGLAVQAVPASADVVYTLSCNDAPCTGSAANHNYGTVTLSQAAGNTTSVRVTVDLAAPGAVAGETFANSNSGFAVAWDLSVVPDSVAKAAGTVHPNSFNVEALNGDYKAAPFTSGANGALFDYAINYTGATGTVGDNKLVFDVTRALGLSLSNFIGNTTYKFAVDIAINGNTFNVAAIGDGVTTHIPEPQTWALFFAGLVGLTWLQRRRKEARVASRVA